MAGTAFLVVTSTVEGLVRHDGYQLQRHWISLLSLGPRGWIGSLQLLVGGLGLVAGAVGFGVELHRRRGGQMTAAMIGIAGLGFTAAAVFPIDPVRDYPLGSILTGPSMNGRAHALAGALVLIGLCGASAFGVRVATGRKALRVTAIVCTVTAAAAIVVGTAVAAALGTGRWEDAYAGFFQRVAVLAGTIWIWALGCDVLRSPSLDALGRRSVAAPSAREDVGPDASIDAGQVPSLSE